MLNYYYHDFSINGVVVDNDVTINVNDIITINAVEKNNDNINFTITMKKQNETSYKLVSFENSNRKIMVFDGVTRLSLKSVYKIYLMLSYSDYFIICYYEKEDEVYTIKLNTIGLEFKIKLNDSNQIDYIKTIIEKKSYNVIINDPIKSDETFLNYGILKLVSEDEDKIEKLLCLYNCHKLFIHNSVKLKYFQFINCSDYYGKEIYETLKNNIDDSQQYINDLPDKLKKCTYKIIDKYKNEWILKDFEDAFYIFVNCIKYNCDELLIKLLYKIVLLIQNSPYPTDINYNIWSIILFNCHSVYSLMIFDLIYGLNNSKNNVQNNLIAKNYHIEFYNKILENSIIKYSKKNTSYKFYYTDVIYKFIKNDYIEYNNSIETLIKYELPFKENKILYSYNSIYGEIEIFNYIINIDDDYEKNTHRYSNFIISYSQCDKLKKDNLITKNALQDVFEGLLANNIKDFNRNKFNININKSYEMAKYLLKTDKQIFYPIQEMIMGSGKSSTITPGICLFIISEIFGTKIMGKNFDVGKNKIFIVMPDFLIEQSAQTIMTNLYPLYNYIEVCVYKCNKGNISNSMKIFLMSDNEMKEKLLENSEYFKSDCFVIYDEIDLMANPLTCELNIPKNEIKSLNNFDLLFDLTEQFYSNIYTNDNFWTKIEENNYLNQGLHKCIFNLTDEIKQTIKDYWKPTNPKNYDHEHVNTLKEYFSRYIIEFVLTNQYNYNYGMPTNYLNIKDETYKYKAIPYDGVDSPLYGSEFSDKILSFVLTFISYNIMNTNKKLRLMDRIKIVETLCEKIIKCNANNCDYYISNFKKFFSHLEYPVEIYEYIGSKNQYNKNLNQDLDLGTDIFEDYLKNTLALNISYNQFCSNTSFSELMIHSVVPNYVGFTGTAYINLPEDGFIEKNANQIEYGLVNVDGTNKVVATAIKDFFESDKRQINYYYVNKNEIITDDIISCLGLYDVLIDVAGFFVNLSNEEILNKYKNITNYKKYFYYWDNGVKIYNIEENKYITNYNETPEDSNTFFYFSNKHITGVDAKKYMYKNAYGLVTISANTNLRDFSQGIFRMRNIMDYQHIDLIMEKKMHNKIEINLEINNINSLGEIDKCDGFKQKNITMVKIFEILNENQQKLENQKKKILYKQNAIGLLKSDNSNENKNDIYMFVDPLDKKIKNNIIRHFNAEQFNHSQINLNYSKIDFNNLNDVNLIYCWKNLYSSASDKNNIINNLIRKYFNIGNDFIQHLIVRNIQTETTTQTETEKNNEIIKQVVSSVNEYQNKYELKTNLILFKYNTSNIKIKNGIWYQKKYENVKWIIYMNETNNIYLTDYITLSRYFLYNEINNYLENISLISIHNNLYFSKLPIDKIKKIKYCSIIFILKNIVDSDKLELTIDDIDFFNSNRDEIINMCNNYTCEFNEEKNELDPHLEQRTSQFSNKYIKYKQKYQRLKKMIE